MIDNENTLKELSRKAIETEEYKNSPYKIGDMVHIKETFTRLDGDVVTIDEDVKISDVYLVYRIGDCKPVLAWMVLSKNGSARKLRSVESIQYKIN